MKSSPRRIFILLLPKRRKCKNHTINGFAYLSYRATNHAGFLTRTHFSTTTRKAFATNINSSPMFLRLTCSTNKKKNRSQSNFCDCVSAPLQLSTAIGLSHYQSCIGASSQHTSKFRLWVSRCLRPRRSNFFGRRNEMAFR